MKIFLFLTLSIFLMLSLHGQPQLDIQGDTSSTDAVVSINVNYAGEEDIVGLRVTSKPANEYGTGGSFKGGSLGVYGESASGTGLYGQSTSGFGIVGQSTSSVGVYGLCTFGTGIYGESTSGFGNVGQSTSGYGIYGLSTSSYGVYGHSTSSKGGYFYGGGGVAIELGGSNSSYGGGTDDAVIRTQANQTDGDLILVSNHVIHLHLDDDDNSSGETMKVFNGGNEEILVLNENGNLSISGIFAMVSDRKRKEKITPVDPVGILTKIAALPIAEWQFRGEDTRHLGPMAQDFYAAFGLGNGNTTIATVDADGVALAAIQALYHKGQKREQQISQLRKEIAELKSLLIAKLE